MTTSGEFEATERAQRAQLPHEVTTAFHWTEQAFRLIESGHLSTEVVAAEGVLTTTITGACPRCGHHLIDRQISHAVTEVRGLGVGPARWPQTVVVDVRCGCGHPHPGAPGPDGGCGVAFRVQLILAEGDAASGGS